MNRSPPLKFCFMQSIPFIDSHTVKICAYEYGNAILHICYYFHIRSDRERKKTDGEKILN